MSKRSKSANDQPKVWARMLGAFILSIFGFLLGFLPVLIYRIDLGIGFWAYLLFPVLGMLTGLVTGFFYPRFVVELFEEWLLS